ncbi:MAG: hypothetical protein PHI03_11855 [Bacteroidales bacterium]|nr:hypothetical protein [Bacteroidales bacterium]MDD4673619.1 hypothetical protein [Bacteroidales bacterium]MDY0217656.1 hypothetical protein [Bacteroidales bacterium]
MNNATAKSHTHLQLLTRFFYFNGVRECCTFRTSQLTSQKLQKSMSLPTLTDDRKRIPNAQHIKETVNTQTKNIQKKLTMYYNGAICDIYIGKGAGKKLLIDIRNAKTTIKIVSPYLSPSLISELIKLQKRNLEIELITTDNIENFYGNYENNIHQLIIQNRLTDYKAVKKTLSRKVCKYTSEGLTL